MHQERHEKCSKSETQPMVLYLVQGGVSQMVRTDSYLQVQRGNLRPGVHTLRAVLSLVL